MSRGTLSACLFTLRPNLYPHFEERFPTAAPAAQPPYPIHLLIHRHCTLDTVATCHQAGPGCFFVSVFVSVRGKHAEYTLLHQDALRAYRQLPTVFCYRLQRRFDKGRTARNTTCTCPEVPLTEVTTLGSRAIRGRYHYFSASKEGAFRCPNAGGYVRFGY